MREGEDRQWQQGLSLREMGAQWQPKLALQRTCGRATISRNAGSSPCEKGGKQWQPTLALTEKRGRVTNSNHAGISPCEKEC